MNICVLLYNTLTTGGDGGATSLQEEISHQQNTLSRDQNGFYETLVITTTPLRNVPSHIHISLSLSLSI